MNEFVKKKYPFKKGICTKVEKIGNVIHIEYLFRKGVPLQNLYTEITQTTLTLSQRESSVEDGSQYQLKAYCPQGCNLDSEEIDLGPLQKLLNTNEIVLKFKKLTYLSNSLTIAYVKPGNLEKTILQITLRNASLNPFK